MTPMFPLPLDCGWCYQPEDKLAWLHGIFKSCIFLLGTIIGHLHDSIHLTTTTRARMHFATILMSCRFVSRVILHKEKIPKTLPCHKGILVLVVKGHHCANIPLHYTVYYTYNPFWIENCLHFFSLLFCFLSVPRVACAVFSSGVSFEGYEKPVMKTTVPGPQSQV